MDAQNKPKIGNINNPYPTKNSRQWSVSHGHVVDAEGLSVALVQSHGYDSGNGFAYWKRSDAETEANARLIAAAPEMLEALLMFQNPNGTYKGTVTLPMLEKIQAAIAKATGGAE